MKITGYGINLLLKLHNWYQDQKFLDLAKKAGDCILLAQLKNDKSKNYGAIYDRFYPENKEFYETFHSYPNAVCAGALCELYQQTKDEKLRNAAKEVTQWLFHVLV